MVLARAWRGQAVGIGDNRKAQVEETSGSSSGQGGIGFVITFHVEEELSTMATLAWAEGSWMGRWAREQI